MHVEESPGVGREAAHGGGLLAEQAAGAAAHLLVAVEVGLVGGEAAAGGEGGGRAGAAGVFPLGLGGQAEAVGLAAPGDRALLQDVGGLEAQLLGQPVAEADRIPPGERLGGAAVLEVGEVGRHVGHDRAPQALGDLGGREQIAARDGHPVHGPLVAASARLVRRAPHVESAGGHGDHGGEQTPQRGLVDAIGQRRDGEGEDGQDHQPQEGTVAVHAEVSAGGCRRADEGSLVIKSHVRIPSKCVPVNAPETCPDTRRPAAWPAGRDRPRTAWRDLRRPDHPRDSCTAPGRGRPRPAAAPGGP